MFVLPALTKVKVLDVCVLSKKDRKPDENPGAQILMQATLGIGILAMFDGFLPGMLYRKSGTSKSQGKIEGLESSELTSLGEHVKRLTWVYEQTGCQIEIDLGLGGSSNITLDDVTIHRVSMRPEQNGVIIQWTVDAPTLSDITRGRLTGLKSTEIQMTLDGPEVDDGQTSLEEEAPEPAQKSNVQTIDGTGKGWPFPKGGVDGDGNAEAPRQRYVTDEEYRAVYAEGNRAVRLAMEMWLAGVPIEQIQLLCGHASKETTERYIKRRILERF